MKQIPFENLNVGRNIPIYLNLETIYEKVVQQNRGGFCYEVNGLFHWLLVTLVFQAQLVAATVKRPNGVWAKTDTHVGIIVELNDKQYLVDVGFGASPLFPVHVDGKVHTDQSGSYKVVQQDKHYFDLMKKADGDWRTLYRFDRSEKDLADFHEGCVFNQVSKDSSFTHSDLVTRPTDNGRLTLSDNTLTKDRHRISENSIISAN